MRFTILKSVATGFVASQVHAGEPMTIDDLEGLDTSIEQVMSAIEAKYGAKPDGFCINADIGEDGYKNEQGLTACQLYNWTCELEAGEQSTHPVGGNISGPSTVASITQQNGSDTDQTLNFTASYKTGNSVEYTTSITAGLSFTATIGVKDVFSTGATLEVSATAGESDTQTDEQTFSESLNVPVPANSQVTVDWIGTQTESTVDFSIPIGITSSCYIGANFPSQVQGHYFHPIRGEDLFRKKNGYITGTLNNSSIVKITSHTGKPEPIQK